MSIQASLVRQLENSALELNERVLLRCQLARELEETGNYEAAREALGELWRRVVENSEIEGLAEATTAEVQLRVGVLSGWIGSARQIEGAQETAKDMVSRSLVTFDRLQQPEKVAEAQTELAVCYWREGAFDEARVVLQDALAHIGENDDELKAVAMLRCALVEKAANRHHDAINILMNAAPRVESGANHALKGKFHGQLANLLETLGEAEGREDYRDRALLEYAAASFHFEQAGHTRYSARVESNLGFLFLAAGRFAEAHQHLDHSRRLFLRLKDDGTAAQINETRARVFLAEGRNAEAEKAARSAVHTLERGDETAYLSEALTTYGTALARLNQIQQSRSALERAIKVSRQAGADHSAGLAALTLIEELYEHLAAVEMRELYERADEWLVLSQHAQTLQRLRHAARRVLVAERRLLEIKEPSAEGFVYASKESAKLLRDVHCLAGTTHPVLIMGETGTGKNLLARLIHQWSGRSGKLVEVNCAMLGETAGESWLFGHRKGSFAGANVDQPGAVREAINGTLFLDEIGELSMKDQTKLLRLIEHAEVHPIGAPQPERVNVRVIATANHRLQEKLGQKLFRSDLFYRLQAFQLEIPPLRKRPADIPVLAEHFIREAAKRHGERVSFTTEALAAMQQLPLRGNARELSALIERVVLTAPQGTEITSGDIETLALRQTPIASLSDVWEGCRLDEEVLLFEGKLIRRALEAAEGQITRAARLLGVTHQCLAYILQGRHKELLKVRTPVLRRKRSIMLKAQQTKEKGKRT